MLHYLQGEQLLIAAQIAALTLNIGNIISILSIVVSIGLGVGIGITSSVKNFKNKIETKADKIEMEKEFEEVKQDYKFALKKHEETDLAYRTGIQNQLDEIQKDTRDIKRHLLNS